VSVGRVHQHVRPGLDLGRHGVVGVRPGAAGGDDLAADVTVRADVVAFARSHGESAVLFAAPRLCARIVDRDYPVPLGADPWKTSRILLPSELAGRTFRHELTGAEIRPTSAESRTWLFAGQVFEHVPVGILRAV
jgi:maltooligosyltrehalose synthase